MAVTKADKTSTAKRRTRNRSRKKDEEKPNEEVVEAKTTDTEEVKAKQQIPVEDIPKPEWVSEDEVPSLGPATRRYAFKIRNAADVTAMLENNMGRWLKIHREYVTPQELYNVFNKDKGETDAKVTVRGWAKAKRGETDFFYATIIAGGLQGRIG